MSDVLEQPQPSVPVQSAQFNPFDDSVWNDAPPTFEQATQQNVVAEPVVNNPAVATPTPAPETPQEEVFDEAQYLKNVFGYENKDDILKELNEWKESKTKVVEFPNEDSRRLYDYIKEQKEDDLYNILDQKRKVDRLLKADLTDKNTAAELVKLAYKSENKDLTDQEVEFLFKKRFAAPPMPNQNLDETDEEYSARKNAWQEIVSEKEMELSIEAKTSKPKIERLKTELVLPDIKRPEPVVSNEPSPEEVAKYEKARERYLQGIESTFQKFNGFNMTYKSEAGDIPIAYVVNEDQKGSFKNAMADFDLGKFIQESWFPSEENPNIEKLTEDVFFLRNKESILQKVASEAYAKGLQHYLKTKSNITIQTPQQTFAPDTTQTDFDKQAAFIWANS